MNGQPLRFYGYGLWPNWGHPKEYWIEQIRSSNWQFMTGCRTHAMEAPASFFEACDETGFLVGSQVATLEPTGITKNQTVHSTKLWRKKSTMEVFRSTKGSEELQVGE